MKKTHTYNRGKLKKEIKEGKLLARCVQHLTDDYRYDAASNFGETSFFPACYERDIEQKELEEETKRVTNSFLLGSSEKDCEMPDLRAKAKRNIYRKMKESQPEGSIFFSDDDLLSSSGSASVDEDGVISLKIHSNLSYELVPNN